MINFWKALRYTDDDMLPMIQFNEMICVSVTNVTIQCVTMKWWWWWCATQWNDDDDDDNVLPMIQHNEMMMMMIMCYQWYNSIRSQLFRTQIAVSP